MTNFFNNSTTSFNDDEINIIRRSEMEDTPILMKESTRNLSRLDLAKEQKLNNSKVRVIEVKNENVRVVADFETQSLYTPRSFDFSNEEDSNVFVSQPDTIHQLPPIENDPQFKVDLKQNIMKFAEEREEKTLSMKEFGFSLSNAGSEAIENPKYGRKRVIRAVDHSTDHTKVAIESKISPDIQNTFSLPKMEKYLFKNGLPVPKIVDKICFGEKM
ncbi:hypothetical protein TVAG_195770 [Trichomonas vaginalis G3]|uniref:Uncharacterized protein n=1 Tax=Trichomonas vaginalis (strain ATCC PRA-98 / G3) TaxID=412133 RepID=A2ETL6_TRIV3|nr:hypothetical protein TVAGG3_0403980 [Trichomonas vaginalis G3]EAY03984.1 hypothetical protein TVAG_195770 [Trichomonas vaginalis G3]KAI5534898.1 hypothetical protein TVAGG3_0403980 [Trichomonas vaginalis G3]|eukprot:XP_001316207.1 hypothetical protein [Trichomonas vaginalis G3]